MNADERKQYLRRIGALPPNEDGLMLFPYGEELGTATQAAKPSQDPDGLMPFPPDDEPEQAQGSNLGNALGAFGRSYAKSYGIDMPEPTANPDDPKEKLKKLMTPELMQRLRERAGVTGA